MVLCKRPAVFLSLAVLISSLTACANSPVAKNLEQTLAADSRLKDNSVIFEKAKQEEPQQNQSKVELPADFPKDIPLYSNAQLQEVNPSSSGVSTRWLSSDPSNIIESFYRSSFQANNWQILQQSTDQQPTTFEARRNDLLLKISIQPKSVTSATPNQPQTATELLIESVNNTTATTQPTPASNDVSQSADSQFIGPVANFPTQSATTPDDSKTTAPTSTSEFSDLNKVPPQLRQHIQDLAALGVLSVESNANKTNTTNQFEPSKIITRREYARWLVAANNAMYANNPSKQIRLASEGVQPAFSDVPKTNPNFAEIQGLAEAGLIPSPVSGDAVEVLFRPDAPLTREQLILWKLPLDTRQALPAANLEAVKQSWGFQDAGKIDPKALRAVLADFQSGEQANIRRVFGYTTLFQPKKPVTRAEAAAALWYFGTQGDGVSAADASKLKRN